MIKLCLHIILFVLLCFSMSGQVLFDESKSYRSEADYLLIPSIHSGYSIEQHEFLVINNGLELKRKFILPEAYIGCQLVANGFTIGIHYGILQKTILLGAGWNIILKKKNKRKA